MKIVGAVALCLLPALSLLAQEPIYGWGISPQMVNLGSDNGQGQRFQVLDEHGQPIQQVIWSVDDPNLASFDTEDNRLIAISEGTVQLTATVGGRSKSIPVRIWKGQAPTDMPSLAVPPLGRLTERIKAEKVDPDGPEYFLLDETHETTFVRAFKDDGIQIWITALPNSVHNARFLCGDHSGGTIVIDRSPAAYELHSVDSSGRMAWSYRSDATEKSHALAFDGTLFLAEQQNRTSMRVVGLDASSGQQKFELPLPESREEYVGFAVSDHVITCSPGSKQVRVQGIFPSNLFVNVDGRGRLAFTQSSMTLIAPVCKAGETIPNTSIREIADDVLHLWKIDAKGHYTEADIESRHFDAITGTVPISVPTPTGELTDDRSNGVLLSVRIALRSTVPALVQKKSDEFIYHFTADDKLDYKIALPPYSGPRFDNIGIPEYRDSDLAFAARGSNLIAFNIESGAVAWHWDAGAEVRIAWVTEEDGNNGNVVVYLPDRVLEVQDPHHQKQVCSRACRDNLAANQRP